MTITTQRPAHPTSALRRAPRHARRPSGAGGRCDASSAMLQHFRLLEPVFDSMPDIVFFVKDEQARYALVNRTLASRCG